MWAVVVPLVVVLVAVVVARRASAGLRAKFNVIVLVGQPPVPTSSEAAARAVCPRSRRPSDGCTRSAFLAAGQTSWWSAHAAP